MSQRIVRINRLLLREFSWELHTRWRAESVRITLTDIRISDDLRAAVLSYSVLGDATEQKAAKQFLNRVLNPIKTAVFSRVKIKYTPEVRLAYDKSSERGVRLIGILDDVAREDALRDERHQAAHDEEADA